MPPETASRAEEDPGEDDEDYGEVPSFERGSPFWISRRLRATDRHTGADKVTFSHVAAKTCHPSPETTR